MKYFIPLLFVLAACSDFDVPNSSFPGSQPDWHTVNYYRPAPLDHCVVMEASENSLIRLCGVNPYYVQPSKTLELPAGDDCIAVFARDQQPKRNPTVVEDASCEDK